MPDKIDWKKALQESRRIEQEHISTPEEIERLYGNTVKDAQKLSHLLKPSWFVKDIDISARKTGKKKVK